MSTENGVAAQSSYVYEPAPSAGIPIGVRDIVWALRRGWWLPVLGCLAGLSVGVAYFISASTPYKSSARILFDQSVNRYFQTQKIVDAPTFDDPEIGSQVYVLSSDSVIVPVVRSMSLAEDPEFVGPPKSSDRYIDKVKELVKQAIGWNIATIDPDVARERTAVEAVMRQLSIYREGFANVVNVSFESKDSNKAARIANAIVDTYIATTLDARLQSTKIVGDWLRDRLTGLNVQATEADRALQDYKIAHNLVETGKGFLNAGQLSSLHQQLTSAQIALSEAKVRLDRIQRVADLGNGSTAVLTAALIDAMNTQGSARTGAINFALTNSDILRLRVQYRDLAARAAEVESHVGPGHAAAIKVRERMEELRSSIREEERRIADSYAHEYEIAKARENELSASLVETLEKAETDSQAQVTMRELESSAETLRNLYNSFLQKFKEINTIQTQTIPVQTARIITRAAPQLQKSSRRSLAVLGGSVMLGLFLGVGAAVGREWMADVFRTPKAVVEATGMHSVVLPMVQRKRRGADWFRRTQTIPTEEFVLHAPYSRFTETLRDVKALIDAAPATGGAKVIGVVSSLSKEGKTTVAANLAALTILASNARTLLIDADLHLRHLTKTLVPDATEGLIEVLDDPSRLPSLVYKRQQSGLDILPCALSTRVPNAAELLGSSKMEQLLINARGSYDYIIIEIPPIISVVDIKKIERFIDGFVFIVEWGQTKRSVLLEALAEADMIRDRIVGVVLNRADPKALRSLESYKGTRYGDYYQG
jgi:polysaccharide biosynthesis transport protein